MRFEGTKAYVATDDLKVAVNAAITLERPLLVKGEPGTGKTVLALEIAKSIGAPLIEWHIKSTTKALQGLYEYDAVSRLRDSQLGDERVQDIRNYIKRGKLWDAFVADERPVLLIDEIDKADIEFPNDLLQELDRMEFFVYETGETVKARRRPVVVITSNNEKELPDAFLRRCFFHYIRFPDPDTMTAIIEVHFPGIKQRLVSEALKLFYEIRDVPGMKKKPSTSELLDWLKLLMVEDIGPEILRERDPKKLIPPLHGALMKNEQDVHLFERLAFMARRDGRCNFLLAAGRGPVSGGSSSSGASSLLEDDFGAAGAGAAGFLRPPVSAPVWDRATSPAPAALPRRLPARDDPALLLGVGHDLLAHRAAEPARLRFDVGRELNVVFFGGEHRGDRRIARRRLLAGRRLARGLAIRVKGGQLLFAAAGEIRHRHVGLHRAEAGTEAGRLRFRGRALRTGAQPPAHHRRFVVERERLLAAGLRLEPGLAQRDDDAGDDLVVDAGERAFLALQDRVVAALAVHARAVAAVDRLDVGGGFEIRHHNRLRRCRRTAEQVTPAGTGAAGKPQRGDAEAKCLSEEFLNHLNQL